MPESFRRVKNKSYQLSRASASATRSGSEGTLRIEPGSQKWSRNLPVPVVRSWGVHSHPYCRGLRLKGQSTLEDLRGSLEGPRLSSFEELSYF